MSELTGNKLLYINDAAIAEFERLIALSERSGDLHADLARDLLELLESAESVKREAHYSE